MLNKIRNRGVKTVLLTAVVTACAGWASMPAAQGATGTWNTNASGTWSTAANWTPGIADGATFTANLTFDINATRTVTMDGPHSIGILNIGDITTSSNSFVLATGSNTLTMDNGVSDAQINQNATSFGDTISGLLAIAGDGNLALSNSSSTKTLTISANISGTGAKLIKNGSGTVALTSTGNTYDGGTTVNNGVLLISSGTLGGTGANTTINAGGTLSTSYALDPTTLGRITASSTGTIALGANSSNDLNFSTITPVLSLGASGAFTYSGNLTPLGTTYRVGGGGGNLTLQNALGDVNSTATSLLVGSGGSVGTVTLGAAGTYTGGTTVTGLVGGTASVLQTNILTGTSNTPFGATTGGITLNNGTLGLGTAATLAAGNVMNVSGYNVTFQGQNTIKLAVGSGSSVTFAANSLAQGTQGGVLLLAPSASANLGTKEIVTVATANAPTVTNGMVVPSIMDSTSQTFLTYDSVKGFVDATPTKVINGNWSSASGTTSTDIVSVTNGNVQGPFSAYAYAGSSVSAYGVRMASNGSFTMAGTINVGAGGVILVNTGGSDGFGNSPYGTGAAVINFGSTAGYIGTFSPGGGTTKFGNPNGGGGLIQGTAGVTFYGSSVLYLNTTSSFTGGLTIAGGGIVQNSNSGAMFNAVTPNALTINKAGYYNWANYNGVGGATFASITGDGLVTNTSGGTASLTINGMVGTGTTTFAGLITTTASNPINLTKSGTTTQIFTGSNSYTGTTTINGGTLQIGGQASLGNGALNIAAGGVLTLDNTIVNMHRIVNASTLSLGGTLNLNGKASAASNETLGALTLAAGPDVVTLNPGAGQSAQLTFASLAARNIGGTPLYRGTGLSTTGANSSNVTFTAAPAVSTTGALAALDGTGTLGATTAAVLHGALFDSSTTGSGIGFATYDPTTNVGVRLLNASTEQTSTYPSATSNANVKLSLSGATPITGQTTNTLQLDNTSGSAVTVTNTGATLNPQNGLLLTGNSAITLTGGTMTQPAGTSDMVILSTNTAGVTIASALNNLGTTAATMGVTIGGSGNITLSGGIQVAPAATATGLQYLNINNSGTTTLTSTVSGGANNNGTTYLVTNVNAGTLKLGTGGSLGSIYMNGSGNSGTQVGLNVQAGATFDLNTVASAVSYVGGNYGGTITNSNSTTAATLSISGQPNYSYNSINGNSYDTLAGNLNVYVGGSISVYGNFTQAFWGPSTYTGTTTLNMPINGTNGKTFGFYLNNPTAIGTGPLVIASGSLDNTSGVPITLTTNNIQTWNGDFGFTGSNALNMGTGTVSLGTVAGATRTITVSGSTLTIGGVISNGTNATTATVNLTKAGAGTMALTASNTYTGVTTINAGTLSVASLANGGLASGIGSSSNAAGNLILNGGILQYTGTVAASTDRNYTFGNATTAAGGGFDASGTGPITISGSMTNANVNATLPQYLALTGTNTGANTLAGNIVNGSGTAVTGVHKTGNGLWVLTGANTYTGPTIVGLGTLRATLPTSTNPLFLSGINTNFDSNGSITGALGTAGVIIGTGEEALSARGGALTVNIGNNQSTLVWGATVTNVDTTGIAGTPATYGGNTITGLTGANLANLQVGMPVSGNQIQAGSYITAISGTTITLNQSAALYYTGASTPLSFAAFNPNVLSLNTATADSALTFQNGLDLNATTRTIKVDSTNANAVATISGVITTSSGTAGLTKTGAGTLALTGSNTYNGVTTVSAGILSTNNLANGSSPSGIGQSTNAAANLVLNGATLQYTGGVTSTDRSFTVGANGAIVDASGTGAVTFNGTIAPAYSNANTAASITLTGASTAANTMAMPITNNGAGLTSVTKTGAGTWALSGTNTYSGGTNVNTGVLQVTSQTSAGGGAFNLGGGTLALTMQTSTTNGGVPGLEVGRVSGAFNLATPNPNAAVQLTTTYANQAYGTSAASNGIWVDNSTYVYTGYLNITTAGQYSFGKNFDDSVSLVIDGQSVINNSGWNTPVVGSLNLGLGYHSFELRLGQGSGGVGPNNSTSGWTTAMGFGWDTQGRNNVAAADFTKMTDPGNGSLFVTGLPVGYFANGVNVTSDSTIDFTGSALTTTGFNTLAIGANTLTINANANQSMSFGITTLTGNATVNVAGGSVNPGSVSGAFGLTKSGAGTMILANANTYSGNTAVSAGTLNLSNSLALQNSTLTTGGIAFDSSVASHAFTLGGLSGSGNIALADSASNAVALTVGNNNSNTTYSGILSGSGSVTKIGTGTSTFTGANTYTGGTTVSAGELDAASLPVNNALTLNGGKMKLTAGTSNNVLQTLSSLSFSNGSTFDLTNHDLLIPNGLQSTSLATYQGKVITNTAVAGATGAPTTIALVSGKDYKAITGTSALNDNDLYGKFTFKGDANLDGRITADDYLALDVGYLFGLTGWTHGDFEQTGKAPTAADYADIDLSYQNQNGKTAAAGEIALHTQWFGAAYTSAFSALNAPAVPEPASLGLLAVGALALLKRRR